MNDLYVGNEPAILMNGCVITKKEFIKESNEKIYHELRDSLNKIINEPNPPKILCLLYESFTWLGIQDRFLALKYYDYVLEGIPSKFKKGLPSIEWKDYK